MARKKDAASSIMRALWPSSKPRRHEPNQADEPGLFDTILTLTGEPLLVPVDRIDEDPHNPRTEFSESEIGKLADDICQHGVLQPIVVHPANAAKRYRIRFGAMRLRAALRAGLTEVPVTICARDLDAYAQVAENQKRRGLSPLDLARFVRGKVEAGDSNAVIAKRLGIDQTTIAHHLALLTLPPVLDQALRSGRCESPRTLYESSRVHADHPERVEALIQSELEITRQAVAALRWMGNALPATVVTTSRLGSVTAAAPRDGTPEFNQVNALCTRIAKIIDRMNKLADGADTEDLRALRRRLTELANL
jgi:ParB family chromosome partitioning protein